MRIFLFIILEYPESSVDFVICIFTHRAGIVNNKIRFLRIRLHITDALQDADKLLGIACVHLAAERRDMERQRTALFCRELFHVIFSDVHKVILALRLALWDLLFIDYFNVYFLFHLHLYHLRTCLPVSIYNIFCAGQRIQSHRSSCVKLLGTDADLRAKSEFKSI